jgi:hypothetical protein
VAFRRDVSRLWDPEYVKDHGNTGSPAWAAVAGLATHYVPLTRTSQAWFGVLDMFILAALFAATAWMLGLGAAGLAMVTGLSIPIVVQYLTGSILRMDWLVALGLSVCSFERRRFRTAGLFLGYAVASKLYAGVMVLPLGLRMAAQAIRHRRLDRDHVRYVVFALGGLAVAVVLSGLFLGDLGLWPDYLERLQATFEEKYYMRNHSFRDLFLQAYHAPGTVWSPLPERIAAAHVSVFIEDVRVPFVVAQLVLLAGLLFVAVRNPPRFALALGPLAVFVLLVSNRYYWQMWMISALALAPAFRKDARSTALLSAILAWIVSMHLVELTAVAVPKGGYFGSYGLMLILLGVIAGEALAFFRERRARRPARA